MHHRPTQLLTIRMMICLLLLCTIATGCVRRRLLIRSNPPGATVYVDNQPVGTTPCATDFIYYGTREIRLVKPGFETLTVNQPIPAPWFQIPPFDFVSENLVPRKIQDYRTLTYNLVPQVIVPTDQLLSRAEQLRQSTSQGLVLPATIESPVGTSPSALAPPVGVLPQPLPPPTGGGQAPEVLATPAGSTSPYGAGTLPSGGQPLEPLPPLSD